MKPKEQIKSIEETFPEGYEGGDIKNEINKIKQYEKKANRNNMIYYSSKEPYYFKTFKTIRSLGENTYSGKIERIWFKNKNESKQADLINYILNFNNKSRSKNRDDKNK